jgi:S1-C subfamily serine protease
VGVVSGTPAAQAGLAAGDVITSVDGHSVDSPATLSSVLGQHHPGDRVQIGWTDASAQQHSASVQLVSGPAA